MKLLTFSWKWIVLCGLFWGLAACLGGTGLEDEKKESSSSDDTTATNTTVAPTTTVAVSVNNSVESIQIRESLSSGAQLDSTITVQFKENVNVSSVKSAISLKTDAGDSIQLQSLTDEQTTHSSLLHFKSAVPLAFATNYRVTFEAPIINAEGLKFSASQEQSFTTRSATVSFNSTSTEDRELDNACCLLSYDFGSGSQNIIAAGSSGIVRYEYQSNGAFQKTTLLSKELMVLTDQDLIDLAASEYTELGNATTALSSLQLISTPAQVNTAVTALFSSTPSTALFNNVLNTVLNKARFPVKAIKMGKAVKTEGEDSDQFQDLLVLLEGESSSSDIRLLSFTNQQATTPDIPFSWSHYVSTDIDALLSDAGVTAIGNLGDFLEATDLNNDNNLDLIVADTGSAPNRLLTFGGVSAGSFALGKTIDVLNATATISEMVVTDLDALSEGRAQADVAVLFEDSLQWFSGDGIGGVSNAINFQGLISPSRMTIADFNQNGAPDIVVSGLADSGSGGRGQLTFLFNRGAGATATIQFDFDRVTTENTLSAIEHGDFNGDQNLDLVVFHPDNNEISVIYGQGNNTFSTPETFVSEAGVLDFLITDLNGDKIDDIISYSGTRFGILWGNSEGNLLSTAKVATGSTAAAPSAAISFNYDTDTNLDLLGLNQSDGDAFVFKGNGQNSFSRLPVELVPATSSSTGPLMIIPGKFDNDQDTEFVVLNKADDSVMILDFTVADSSTGSVPKIRNHISLKADSSTEMTPVDGIAGDFNADGLDDLVIAVTGTNQLIFLFNSETGFSESLRTSRFVAEPFSLAGGYLNGDENFDFVMVSQSDNTITAYLGNGVGHFVEQTAVVLPEASESNVALGKTVAIPSRTQKTLGGKVKTYLLAVLNPGTSTDSNSTNDVYFVNYNGGKGTLERVGSLDTTMPPQHILASDLNGDLVPELVFTSPNRLSVFSSALSGSYESVAEVTVGSNPQAPVAGDFNNDGALDLIVMDQASHSLSVLLQR